LSRPSTGPDRGDAFGNGRKLSCGVRPAKFGGYKDFALAGDEELVRQLVAEQPDITLAELETRLAKRR
jgi:hypothetical protein